MAKKKAENLDVEALLSAADAETVKSKSKSDIPTFDVPELADTIKLWKDAKEAEKTAKSNQQNAESVIFPKAESLRVRASKERHEFLNSVRLNPGGVTFTQKNVFSDIPSSEKAQLQKVCEEEGVQYSKYFESYPDISLVSDLTKEQLDRVVKGLVKEFGSELTSFFAIKYPVRVLTPFIKDVVFDDKVERVMNRLGPASPDPIIKPYKPSLR